MKRLIIFILSAALFAGCISTASAASGMENFEKVRNYSNSVFTDVEPDAWYAESVVTVYEYGLMNGIGDGIFDPSGAVTMTQAIAMAARLHRIYNTGKDDFLQGRAWYDTYVRYSLENGIISTRFGCKKAATRAQFADTFSRALPSSELKQINNVEDDSIPGVWISDQYAEGIYLLYRAGVITGSDSRGTFNPDSGITRAEAAAILARMLEPERRLTIDLSYQGPDVPESTEQSDEFFEDAAILGNSLVDGLRIYSDLQSIDYYCGTSVTVISAMKTANTTLNNGASSTLVNKMLQEQYSKIYIELGINEIGYDVDTFIGMYAEMLDAISAGEPNADIYIISLLPVTKSKSNSSSVFNMTRVNAYNEALRELAQEKGCYYLDVCSAYLDSEGYLSDDWDADGVHLLPDYYSVWEDYMRTHY